MEWYSPSQITNCIIELSPYNFDQLNKVTKELSELGCNYLELRSYSPLSTAELIEIFDLIHIGKIRNINLYIKWIHENTEIIKFKIKNSIIGSIFIHSCAKGRESSETEKMVGIHYIQDKIESSSHCGIVDKKYFLTNIMLFTEAQSKNSCLNQKISIDEKGDIKNCPSMKVSFGNIKNTTLAEAIEKPDFKKYWDINKDKIHVCKDCEFRYICTDCRAYIEDPEDIFSKPLKCGYNPYTGEWSKNPLKQKSIDFYGMRNMVENMD